MSLGVSSDPARKLGIRGKSHELYEGPMQSMIGNRVKAIDPIVGVFTKSQNELVGRILKAVAVNGHGCSRKVDGPSPSLCDCNRLRKIARMCEHGPQSLCIYQRRTPRTAFYANWTPAFDSVEDVLEDLPSFGVAQQCDIRHTSTLVRER
jgi:hypothetical protein